MADHMTHRSRLLEEMGKAIAGVEDQVLEQGRILSEVKRAIVFDPSVYRKRPAVPLPHLIAVSAAAAVVLFAVVFVLISTITVRVGGRSLNPGDWISTQNEASAVMSFSDGSRVTLNPSSGARIQALHRNGAHLLLERGSLTADVRHKLGTHWRIDVGPYTVIVTGTRFTVSWDAATETFHLNMKTGIVDVRGPMIDETRTVRADQQLTVSPVLGRMAIASGNSDHFAPPRDP